MKSVLIFVALAVSSLSGAANADSSMSAAPWANRQLDDRSKEAEARALMEEIRCLVCQGQSIADSDAEMAGDMRALIRERVARGEQPAAIRAWLIDRYGPWVSYRPPTNALTWPLWALPLLLLAIGGWLLRGRLARRR